LIELIRPFENSYWVIPGRLLAGEYPGSPYTRQASERVRSLLALGVTFFLDLTSPADYLLPYAPHLNQDPPGSGSLPVKVNHPIRDFDIPTRGAMKRILDALDGALSEGHIVYVHCWGGAGRTGTVIGCHLVRHGMPGEQAIEEIARLREVIPAERRRLSPETDSQQKMVRSWRPGA